MSTQASGRAYQLYDAVIDMAARLATAERDSAYARTDEEIGRCGRACRWRLRALVRLTAALRDLPMKEEKE